MVSNKNESEVVFYASIDEQQVVFDASANEEPVINNDETVAEILTELNSIYDKRTQFCENTVITKVMEKISVDLKYRFTK